MNCGLSIAKYEEKLAQLKLNEDKLENSTKIKSETKTQSPSKLP